MHAEIGDWLVVPSRTDSGHARRAEILSVRSADGAPPYAVRWLDDGRESLAFPGPDSDVVTAAEQTEINRLSRVRIARVQDAIASDKHHDAEQSAVQRAGA